MNPVKQLELARIFEKCYWHQRWEVEPGVFTPGCNDVAQLLERAGFPERIDGKRVLDIGAWNGCFSFECERRGAAQVVAIGPEQPTATGFNELREYLGSKVTYRLGSIYDLDPAVFGFFDIVLCFGVFYHLRYPMLGIDNLRRVCRGNLYLESACLDHDLSLGSGEQAESVDFAALHPRLPEAALLQFIEGDGLNHDYSNWFSPNLAAMRAILNSAGFTVETALTEGVRLYMSASVRAGLPDFLSPRSCEGAYYDLFLRKWMGPFTDWEAR